MAGRGLSSANLAEVDANHLAPVVLVHFAFTAPLYVHTGVGNITFGGDVYVGVGDLGAIPNIEETQNISPAPLHLALSSIQSEHVTIALDAGHYGDVITLYEGFRQDDGALVDDPVQIGRGKFEFANIELGETNQIIITMQHDLATITEIAGDRFTNEDQQSKFAGDDGFAFVTESINKTILWAGGPNTGNRGPGMTPRLDGKR